MRGIGGGLRLVLIRMRMEVGIGGAVLLLMGFTRRLMPLGITMPGTGGVLPMLIMLRPLLGRHSGRSAVLAK